MSKRNVNSMIKEIELTLSGIGSLPPDVEKAIEKLLNIVEILSHDNQSLKEEVSRLGKQLDKKKRAKTTMGDQAHVDGSQAKANGHSSEARRKRRTPIQRKPIDRRSFKDLTIQRHVYYSAKEHRYFRGPLPRGYDVGDFGADLRSLILSLKYCGNMSEPKIREFLENFDVEISAGSVSNILTKTADQLALCWIHEGRHYERLNPVVGRHAEMLESYVDRFWDYYVSLQDYRADSQAARSERVRILAGSTPWPIRIPTPRGIDKRGKRTHSTRRR